MARTDTATASEIDWTQCELIERVPGKVSGRPIVRGTRVLPEAIVNSYDPGEPLDLIHESYPGSSMPQIQRLIDFAHLQRGQRAFLEVSLDENLPHLLRNIPGDHEVFTVRYKGWG